MPSLHHIHHSYYRRILTSRLLKLKPFLFILLFIAPFILLSLITPYLHSNITASLQKSQTYSKLIQLKGTPLNTSLAPTVFDPNDVNNPTKVPVPPDGFPPPSLAFNHPNFLLLNTIRARCQLTPRWPNHPRIHVPALRSYGPAYSSIIISDRLKVIYVPVFKVGTTSMMWHIAYLENNQHVLNHTSRRPGALDLVLHQMSSLAWQNHTVYRRNIENIRRVFEDPSYLKFGFVRNPFDRIISAYVDKIINWSIDSSEYQKQMWALYGDNETNRSFSNLSKPSFREFLERVADVLRMPRTPTSDLWDSEAFENNTSRRDMHWRPQVELLHPDLIHLDFVGRFESIERDRGVVLDWMYRHTDRRMPLEAKEKLHATNPKDKIELYEMLRQDEALRNLVVDTYSEDFERFQFSQDVPDAR